jgi:hypothetical protein
VRAVVAILLLSITSGCAASRPRVQAQPLEAPFAIEVPHFFTPGDDVEVRCYVPDSYGAGMLTMGIAPWRVHTEALDLLSTRLVVRSVPCGVWTAFCAVDTVRGRDIRTRTIEPTIPC